MVRSEIFSSEGLLDAPDDAILSLDTGEGPDGVTAASSGHPLGAVVAGGIVAHDDDLDPLDAEAVRNSTLLAQLAANVPSDRYRDPAAWYRKYFEVIETVGWVVQERQPSQRYRSNGTEYTADTVIEKAFGLDDPLTGGPRILSDMLAALRFDRGPARGQAIFECASHAGGLGNFQAMLVEPVDQGAAIQLGRFRFNTTAHVVRIFHDPFPTTTDFEYGITSFVLSRERYARVGEAVKNKLGRRKDELIEVIMKSGRPEGDR